MWRSWKWSCTWLRNNCVAKLSQRFKQFLREAFNLKGGSRAHERGCTPRNLQSLFPYKGVVCNFFWHYVFWPLLNYFDWFQKYCQLFPQRFRCFRHCFCVETHFVLERENRFTKWTLGGNRNSTFPQKICPSAKNWQIYFVCLQIWFESLAQKKKLYQQHAKIKQFHTKHPYDAIVTTT